MPHTINILTARLRKSVEVKDKDWPLREYSKLRSDELEEWRKYRHGGTLDRIVIT